MEKTYTAEQVQELDLRRQAQISNQVATINRLLEGGATYDSEMKNLQEQLAEAQVRIAELEARDVG